MQMPITTAARCNAVAYAHDTMLWIGLAADWPAIAIEDLSVASFDAGHKLSGKVADGNDSLATAEACFWYG